MTQEKKALWEERECEKRERAGKQGVKVGRFGEGRYRDVSPRGIGPYRFSSQCPWQQLVLHVLKGKSPVGGVIGEPGRPTLNIFSVTHHQSLFVLRFPSQAHECHSMREWVWTWIHLRTTVLLGLVGHTVHNDSYISLWLVGERIKSFQSAVEKALWSGINMTIHDDSLMNLSESEWCFLSNDQSQHESCPCCYGLLGVNVSDNVCMSQLEA